VPLEAPGPDHDLRAFPARVVAGGDKGERLFRVFRYRDPSTGRRRPPFFFASAYPDETGGGRYDLPLPDGACYLATTALGAWLETFRGVGVVAVSDVQARRMLVTSPPRPLRAANLVAAAARRFGVTAEISTTNDYGLTRRWAAALRRAGFGALWGQARHDPTLRHRTLTLLDRAGDHLPFGWRWRHEVVRIDTNARLMAAVTASGFVVAEIPYDV
jgi:hypothetical protein